MTEQPKSKFNLIAGMIFAATGILGASVVSVVYHNSDRDQIAQQRLELAKQIVDARHSDSLKAYEAAIAKKQHFEAQPVSNPALLGAAIGSSILGMIAGANMINAYFNGGQSQPQPTNSSAPTPRAARRKQPAGNKPA